MIIGIAGGTGSGKTTFVNALSKDISNVAVLSMDNYYKDFGHIPLKERPYVNYDHPDAFDWDLLYDHICMLKEGKSIEQPIFSFHTCTRENNTIFFSAPKILIVEGILAFYDERIRNIMDIKVFIDIDSGIRLLRVIERDKIERNHSEELVRNKYISVLEPMHKQYVDSTKCHADIIIASQKNSCLIERLFRLLITSYADRV